MKKLKTFFLFGMVGLLGLMINSVYAIENEEDVTLKTVVVTGTRIQQRIEKVPANVTVIDEEDIKNSNAKTVVDLLRSEEGIVVRDLLGHGKTAQVDLRGFGETGPYNTLVLVDGRRVNEIDLSGVDWTQIPLEQIERIEIVRGTGTVLYGDNAVGGVINIITKIPTGKLTVRGGALAGSYSRHKEQASISGGHKNLAASLFASYDSTDGYRDNGEFRAKDIGGKIVFDPTELLSLNLSGSYHSDDYSLPGPLTEEEVNVDRRATNEPFNEAETRDKYLKLESNLDLGHFGNILADFSVRDRNSELKDVSVFGTFLQDIETETWAITPRYVWNGEIANHENTLIVGVDFYWSDQDVKSFFGTPPIPSGLANVEKNSSGLYFSNEFSLLKNLIFSFGARRELVEYDLINRPLTGFPLPPPPLSDTVSERQNAFSAGLTFLYGGKSSFFVRANRSFRFPLTDELVEFDQLTGQPRVNSDLKPQKGRHYEAGLRHFFAPDLVGSVTLFRAEMKDEIFLDPTPAPFFGTNVNHPETLHQGVEIGAKSEIFGKITLFGNYTYEKGAFEKEPFKDNDIPAVPNHKANLGIRIHDVFPGLIFSADYKYVGSSFLISDQANEFEKLDDYATIDARLSYAWKRLNAFVGVNNLTNEKYSQYGVIGGTPKGRNFYPAPERNWLAGLDITF
ncbi:MAG: TonB-dependent receptor [Deltaproteobacteria bacterium]|nr:MAG: TonB-dependent receptor [Deltaproteobacteria bacterium]